MSKTAHLCLKAFLVTWLLLMVWAAPVTHSKPLQQDADFDAIDAYIEGEMAEWNLPGVALAIVQDGEIVYMKGYGNAGPDGRPMTAQTPLFIGSTSKSFTALAIMQLVEDGKIDLDEPAQIYLPWFRVADEAASARITVRQMLNQDSGLSVASGRQWIGSKDQSNEAVNNAVRALADDQLSNPVGEAYEYSNANYQGLGAIVQAVSGQSFEDYVQDNIYDPLEMSNCYTSQDEALQNEMGDGYVRWWFNIDFARTHAFNRGNLPSGTLICDAEGMAHYLIGYLNEGQYGDARILSPQGIAQMHSPAVPQSDGGDSYYGMGWVVGPINGVDAVHHGGDNANYQTALLMVPDEELGIVLITNTNHTITINSITSVMAADVMNMLRGEQTAGYEQNPFIKIIQLTLLGPLALALLWAGWSIARALRRRKQGDPSPKGIKSVMWRIVLPLILGGFFIFYFLILTPMLWQNIPLRMFPLYYPDAWSVMVLGALAGGVGIIVHLAVNLGAGKEAA
jgi:CubicO group peptidase (beta-lactamase class C family)